MGRGGSRVILWRREGGQGGLENHGGLVVWCVLVKEIARTGNGVRSRALLRPRPARLPPPVTLPHHSDWYTWTQIDFLK